MDSVISRIEEEKGKASAIQATPVLTEDTLGINLKTHTY